MTRVRWSAPALWALASAGCTTEFDAALLHRDDAVASNSNGMLEAVVPSEPVPDTVPPSSEMSSSDTDTEDSVNTESPETDASSSGSDNLPLATGGGAPTLSSSAAAGGSNEMPGNTGGTGTAGAPPVPSGTGGQVGTAGAGGITAGSGGTAGASGGRGGSLGVGGGGAPQVTYGVVAQSCGTQLECPGASCCAQLEIPSGEFQMGTNTDAAAGSEEKPPHDTSVAGFFLDQFEVTVGRFRSYAEAYDGTLPATGSGAHPRVPNSGWQLNYDAQMPTSKAALLDRINCDSAGGYQTFTEAAGVRDGMPMNCVDWHLAFAFCIWDGGRLPTEAEWEMATAGGDEERLYAWGSLTPDPTLHAAMNCLADGEEGCTNTDLLPVGQFPDGAARWGHLDLAGNLWEWTLDYYDATYYQSIGSCDNCSNLNGSTPRVIRGGNFTSLVTSLRATTRASYPPNTVVPYVGLRCARSAP